MTFCYRDAGLYHCVATRSYGNSYTYNRRRETVFMEVDFDSR